ncbi:hypothetical protein Acid345_1279 [Candidatus Koribacter versatilis Ellin345]|uniref:DUF5666 domain-containing protein n=1 Tax=Koribacter versatilis (strain Ellin345) TaxID=204669 RepID=Q1IS69_KORVE|nr:hypothetical protein [Candidatus Koribacter versatilis]ABF40281.1 hypothetical protein Acid345_1279 [Candidatus Koribacter versatilis Ellin345]
MIKTLFLSLLLCASCALAQSGTRPDPVAGTSSAQPGAAPSTTPQAQPSAPPAEKPATTEQNNAATQATDAKTPAPASTQPPTNTNDQGAAGQSSAPEQSTPKQNAKPQSDAAPNMANVEITPAVSGAPETKILDSSAVGKHTGVTGAPDPLLDVPPLPKGKPTLIGGVATKVDRIHSRVTVEPYGAKNKMPIYIDERSHIYRNGVETTIQSIKKGDRVYFDTMLDGANVFAKNVRVISETGAAEVRGRITSYDAARGVIQLQDALSSKPVSFRISNQTQVKAQQGTASMGDIAKGALVDVVFAPDKANRGIAKEVTLLAKPGASYTFAGVITNVNLRDGVVSVENQTDGKVYDIEFDGHSKSERSGLKIGNSVNIAATFDGENYRATNVTVTEAAAKPKDRPDQKKPKADSDDDKD